MNIYHLPNIIKLTESLRNGSGVVGRERMGTAFPHKKLSGNGVPTREILSLFCIITIKFLTVNYYVITFSAPQTMSKLDIRICKA